MTPLLRRLLLLVGLGLFAGAALLGYGAFGDATVSDVLATVAAGLACWIAATLP